MENNNNETLEYKEIDFFLFFDLVQGSEDIFNLTSKDDILILIGDTPSYYMPILKQRRKVFNFPFSNKPFGCFIPPFGEPLDKEEISKELIYIQKLNPSIKISDPFERFNKENQRVTKYFEYLNNNTKLTKEFLKKNWNNIVLIDSSSGESIHGVSIFFNKYVGNINQENECINISGSKPLQFIQLVTHYYRKTNMNLKLAKKYFTSELDLNFNPDLIINIGSVIFYHRELFMIYQEYPRYVPLYTMNDWGKDPYDITNHNLNSYNLAIDNTKKIEKMYRYYYKIQNDPYDIKYINKLLNLIKDMPIENKETSLKIDFNINNLKDNLNLINIMVLRRKYSQYFIKS